MGNARFDSVWGKLPPSLKLTPTQMRTLDRYINSRVVKVCYRVAYDAGRDSAGAGASTLAKELRKATDDLKRLRKAHRHLQRQVNRRPRP